MDQNIGYLLSSNPFPAYCLVFFDDINKLEVIKAKLFISFPLTQNEGTRLKFLLIINYIFRNVFENRTKNTAEVNITEKHTTYIAYVTNRTVLKKHEFPLRKII